MRVLIAPQEFKGSLTAVAAARAMAEGVRRADTEVGVDLAPLSDGGPGFLDAMLDATDGTRLRVMARDPLGRSVEAAIGLIDAGRTAIIESAEATGIKRLRQDEFAPRYATTSGVGDLILAALDAGAERLIVGLGGSATNDGGAGMAQALGVRLLDGCGVDLPPGGAALRALAAIDATGIDPRLAAVDLLMASDVRNPLCGPDGASAVFGPQKGADAAAVRDLDAALKHYAVRVSLDLGIDVGSTPGAGAAGGLGAGLIAFLDARVQSGFDLVSQTIGLETRIGAADLVLTGEGRLDGQTGFGKTVAGVARLGHAAEVPVVALCGGLAPGWRSLLTEGLTAAFSVVPAPMTLDDAHRDASELVTAAAEQVIRLTATFASRT
ncbi:MAG: glycerate kinase [Dehalococcoidia bacterium]